MELPYTNIPLFAETQNQLNVIIDTPKGSRNKFAFDEKMQLFKLKHVLPAGAVFPFDFGYLPGTLAEDGDPLDVLLLLDAPTFTGCLVEARLIGALQAEQTKAGKTSRNDRLVAVAAASREHEKIKNLHNLPAGFLEEASHFFISYNEARDIKFKILAHLSPAEALKLVKQGAQKFQDKPKRSE